MLFNTTALDGSDGLKSAIKEMGGDVFESRKADYAQYLCGLKNERNESIWTKKAQNGMIPEELKSMETKFGPLLKIVQKKGNLPEAETPEGYTGSDEVTDPNSSLDTQEGYLILRNHGHKISIVPSEEEP